MRLFVDLIRDNAASLGAIDLSATQTYLLQYIDDETNATREVNSLFVFTSKPSGKRGKNVFAHSPFFHDKNFHCYSRQLKKKETVIESSVWREAER